MRTFATSCLLAAAFVAAGFTVTAPADGDPGWGTVRAWDGPLPASGSANFQTRLQTLTVGGAEAKGIGLRQLGSGTLTLADLPAGATVLAAYLYWMIMDNAEGAGFKDVTFDGQAVQGTLIDSGPGLCWGAATTFAYRADVTNLIHGPGPYALADVKSGLTDGSNLAFPRPLAQGASLVVVWRDLLGGRPMEAILIDGFVALIGNSAIVNFPQVLLPPVPVLGFSRIVMMGGDGQKGFNEDRVRVNGVVLGVDFWDGSDPQRIPDYSTGNLWDTDAHDVTAVVKGGTPTAILFESLGDCFGPQALLYTQRL